MEENTIVKKEPKIEALIEEKEQAKPYDHTNEHMIKACGLTDDQIEDLKSLSFEFIKESKSFSEMCEKMEGAFNKRELAFLATQHVAHAMKQSMIASKMEKVFREIEKMEE